jgi:site-specific recombinase XerD
MYLVKRNKIYHAYYYDEYGSKKTFSTKSKLKSEALKVALLLVNSPKETIASYDNLTLGQFREIYSSYTSTRFTIGYQKLVNSAFIQFSKVVHDSTLLSKINVTSVEKFIELKSSEGKTLIINGYLRALQGAFQRAIEFGYLKENVFKKVKKLKFPENPPLILSKSDFASIVEAESDSLLKLLYLFAYNTGMRRDEIRLLKWDSIDLKKKIIIVKNHNNFTTKSKKSRLIPINDTTEKEVFSKLKYSDIKDYVFMKEGKCLTKEFITKRFKKVIRITNLNSEYHFHTLRHTFASSLVQKGISIYIVSKLLGHADIKTTMIYSHLRTEDLRNAIELLSE